MKVGKWVGASAVATGILLGAGPATAVAQNGGYQCISNGSSYFSRMPCPTENGPRGTVLRQVGPLAEPRVASPSRYTPQPNAAESHIHYLGAECARISEGLRNGPTLGVPHGVLSDLRREYNQKCRDEEQDARRLARDDETRARKDRSSAQLAEQHVHAAAARNAAQCDEMLGALARKRRRIETLTQGEKDDMARFQSNYDERCKSAR